VSTVPLWCNCEFNHRDTQDTENAQRKNRNNETRRPPKAALSASAVSNPVYGKGRRETQEERKENTKSHT